MHCPERSRHWSLSTAAALSALLLSACGSGRAVTPLSIMRIDALVYAHVPGGDAICDFDPTVPSAQKELPQARFYLEATDAAGKRTLGNENNAIVFDAPPAGPVIVKASPRSSLLFRTDASRPHTVTGERDLPLRIMVYEYSDGACVREIERLEISRREADQAQADDQRAQGKQSLGSVLLIGFSLLTVLGVFTIFCGDLFWKFTERNLLNDLNAGRFATSRQRAGAFRMSGIERTDDPDKPFRRTRWWDGVRIIAGLCFLVIGGVPVALITYALLFE